MEDVFVVMCGELRVVSCGCGGFVDAESGGCVGEWLWKMWWLWCVVSCCCGGCVDAVSSGCGGVWACEAGEE